MSEKSNTDTQAFDPVLLAVLANRLDAIVREMQNTLLRAGRSLAIALGRDFSCSLITADNELLASAEGLPVHIFGTTLQTQSMTELHDDIAEGDAFLHNDPYLGNTHAADHTILVPVFVDGEHLFTACAKAHQADCGNSLPTTYMPFSKDVYEEGALIFPCVRIQHDYRDNTDIIRMCQKRIRVPEIWYGDYLAALGSARTGERRLKELVKKYGKDVVADFVREWLDYSERRTIEAIRELPRGRLTATGAHDPLPGIPEGVPVKAEIEIDPEEAKITIDLRDNIDTVPAGINQSMATAINNSYNGVFNVLDPDIPHNAGSFRRISVLLREGSVAGIPRFPTCVSMATTALSTPIVNMIQAAFAELSDGMGLAEGGGTVGSGVGMLSGTDSRRGAAPFVQQLILANNGGPASPWCDGWLTWSVPQAAGLTYRDSVEIDEMMIPIMVRSVRLLTDSGGAGRFRGGVAAETIYGPRWDPVNTAYTMDMVHNPAKGVRGGYPGLRPEPPRVFDAAGEETEQPPLGLITLVPGQWIRGVDAGGGGYGSPLERDPARVRYDVLERWVSLEQARDVYGTVFTGDINDDSLEVDEAATRQRRKELQASSSR